MCASVINNLKTGPEKGKRPCGNIRIPSHDHILTENITCEQKIKFVSNQERYLKKPIISAEKIAC